MSNPNHDDHGRFADGPGGAHKHVPESKAQQRDNAYAAHLSNQARQHNAHVHAARKETGDELKARLHGSNAHQHAYNPKGVQDAIDSHNRRGGKGRIGGKEASAIHRILKGRG